MRAEACFSDRYRSEIQVMVEALIEAGDAVDDLYRRAAASTYVKSDGSPVTDADLAADQIIRSRLSAAFPGDALLTEEGIDDKRRLQTERCWIVDPIDGTQQFVDRTGDFDCLIALVEHGSPILVGSIQPTTGTLCIAVRGEGAFSGPVDALRRVHYKDREEGVPLITTSVWFGAPENLPFLEEIAQDAGAATVDYRQIGFTPRLFLDPRPCDAILGFRTGDDQFMAYDWDFAVGDLFIHEAGGRLTDLAGRRLKYNQERPIVDAGVVAAVAHPLHEQLLRLCQAKLASNAIRPDLTRI